MSELSSMRVMVVDDTEANIDILLETLVGDYKVVVATDGESALEDIKRSPPDLILLDIMMPGIDGFEVCRRLKADPETEEIPVMFLSALDDTADKVKGLDLGAVDYISKPFQPEEVIARVNTHLTISSLKKSLAEKNKALQASNEILEERVKERTADLVELITAYERFVPREFLSLLDKESILQIRLGDQINQEMTVMFADVRGVDHALGRYVPAGKL